VAGEVSRTDDRIKPDEWATLLPEAILGRLGPLPHRRVCLLAAAIQELDTAALARRHFPEWVLRSVDPYLDRLRDLTAEMRRLADHPPTGWQVCLEVRHVIKELAVQAQDFETAAWVRDDEDRIRQPGRSHFADHLRTLCLGWMQRPDPDPNYRGPIYPRPGLIDPDRDDRLRELMGDVFFDLAQPVVFAARWHTSDVVGLARGIYEDDAFDRLPLLADALMDAGCADEDVLGHCRSAGPHVRGCWVVERSLGKALK
jgi:hypothetical protein